MNLKTSQRTLLLSIWCSLAILSGAQSAHAQELAIPVSVDAVRIQPFNQTVPVLGRLVATQSGVVAARTAGPLGELRVQVGDRVKKNEIIAVLINNALISQRDLRLAEVNQAKTRIETSKAQLELRQQELKRLNMLRSSAAFSQARMDDKKQEVVVMNSTITEDRAALNKAQANLRLTEINLYNADIRAPFDSIITMRHTNVGAFLLVADPVVSLIDDTTLEIEADIPTDRIPGLPRGTIVNYTLTDDTRAEASGTARVRAIVPNENPLTRTRSVRFSTTFALNSNLAENQSVTVNVPAGAPRQVMSVHKDAIINKAGRTIVYVVIDGKAVITTVELGTAIHNRFEVIRGLKENDLVVIRGNERLLPNQAVSFESASSN